MMPYQLSVPGLKQNMMSSSTITHCSLFGAAEQATAKFIQDAVDKLWYHNLHHHCLFYTSIKDKQLIEHLDANCGGLHPSELVNLPTKMMSYYKKAIPEYIDLLEEAH